jgi:lysophospholipase L1-like esterase
LVLIGAGGLFAAQQRYRSSKLAILGPRQPVPVEEGIAAGTPPCILLLGDSRIAQWPLAGFTSAPAAKIGYPGEALANIGPWGAARLQAVRPRIVVIQAGYNDATAAMLAAPAERDAILRRSAEALAALVDAARAAGATPLLTTVPPANRPEFWRIAIQGGRSDNEIAALNDAIRRLGRTGGIPIVDADRLLRDPSGALRRDFRTDATHWSSSAYVVLTRAIEKAVQGLAGGPKRRGNARPGGGNRSGHVCASGQG